MQKLIKEFSVKNTLWDALKGRTNESQFFHMNSWYGAVGIKKDTRSIQRDCVSSVILLSGILLWSVMESLFFFEIRQSKFSLHWCCFSEEVEMKRLRWGMLHWWLHSEGSCSWNYEAEPYPCHELLLQRSCFSTCWLEPVVANWGRHSSCGYVDRICYFEA
jgi:hypothetical protein